MYEPIYEVILPKWEVFKEVHQPMEQATICNKGVDKEHDTQVNNDAMKSGLARCCDVDRVIGMNRVEELECNTQKSISSILSDATNSSFITISTDATQSTFISTSSDGKQSSFTEDYGMMDTEEMDSLQHNEAYGLSLKSQTYENIQLYFTEHDDNFIGEKHNLHVGSDSDLSHTNGHDEMVDTEQKEVEEAEKAEILDFTVNNAYGSGLRTRTYENESLWLEIPP